MPELAEVEFFRRRWHEAADGHVVATVQAHATKKIFRQAPARLVQEGLVGQPFAGSEARAKQMAFRFGADRWLGIHLGMTGELFVAPADYHAGPHDHLTLHLDHAGVLVFRDPRMFGNVRWHQGPDEPSWWRSIAPSLLSSAFDRPALSAFLDRRARAPIKAVLLMQERFPGIGNWMADEILWRAASTARSVRFAASPSPRLPASAAICRLT